MKSYTLTLITGQTNDFTVSLNGTALTTTQFNSTFFSAAGVAQFAFDTSATNFTIWDSSAMSGRSVAGTAEIDSTKVYDVEWTAASGQTTNTFTSVVEDDGYAMTKYQISDLMGKIKRLPVYDYPQDFSTLSSSDIKALNNLVYITKQKSFFLRVNTAPSGGFAVGTLKYSGCNIDSGTTVFITAASIPNNLNQNADVHVYGKIKGTYAGSSNIDSIALWSSSSGNAIYAISLPVDSLSMTFTGRALDAKQGYVLNGKILGVSSGTIAAAWTTIGTNSKYTKRALQVTVNINETSLTLTANDWNTLFTLPSDYRPASELTTGCTMTDNGTLVNGLVKITTAGEVQVMAGSNTTEVYGLLTIPVAS